MKTFITSPHDYRTPEAVPELLRDAIKFAHGTGVPLDALAVIYAMDLNWIRLFALDAREVRN